MNNYTKDCQSVLHNSTTPLSDGMAVGAPVLHFCTSVSGLPFGFVYNGVSLGDKIVLDCPGLPEPVCMAFALFQSSLQEKFRSSKSGCYELTGTVCFDGVNFTFLFSRFLLPEGNKAEALVSIRDITNTCKREGENHISETLLELVVESMTDVFCVLDMEGKLTFVSPSVEKLIGYKAGKLMQSPLTEFVAPDTKQVLEDALSQLYDLRKKCSICNLDKEPLAIEIQFIAESGGGRWTEISLAPFTGHDNIIKGVYGIIRDISDYKQQQAEMQSSLQYEIERGKVKSRYISSVSHEFRTPLSIIYSNLQLLESHQHELDAETIADSFELSKMAVKSLLRVLDKVVIIDAIGKGKLEFKPAFVDLPELLQSVINDLNEMEIFPGRIKVSIDPSIGLVYIDEYLFRHAFSNLLHNALNYSDKKQFVEMNIALNGTEFLTFEIKDNGIGIPTEDMNLLFEPFYRASNARYIKGSGLGLSVLNECLQLHKGTVEINSELGKGTVVKVVLPIAQVWVSNLENNI